MATRPALTAIGCRSCQHVIYRAILSSSAPAMRITASRYQSLPPQSMARRLFSTETKLFQSKTSDTEDSLKDVVEEAEELDDQPWFLEEEPPRHPPSQHQANLPKIPEDAPAMLDPMLKYIYEDMGLDDISMLDLRDLDPSASLGPNLIMLFATTRSERHLHVSSGRFVRWLRKNHNVPARAEGLIGAGELKTKLRRLRKKAKLMGQNTAMIPGGDNGISTGWVCVNFQTQDSGSSEGANFDESGSFSGFGSSQSGTTVVVQCMTEARRTELDLESLWKGILRRNLEEQMKIRGELANGAQLDQMLASRLQLHEAPGTSQFDAMKRAGQQHRYYSTSARRLQRSTDLPASSATEAATNATTTWEQELINTQLHGAPLDQGRLESIVSDVLRAPLSSGIPTIDRLALVDQLLETGDERGLKIRSRTMLVTLIESLVTSPAYGPELGRAQMNFEMLLTELQEPLDVKEIGRLMNAYSSRQDWERFWDVFRSLSRFNLPRPAPLYELAFRTMAATGSAGLCADAIRWAYFEMLAEEEPVPPQGQVYRSLRACILVADPWAEEYLHNPPPMHDMSAVKQREITQREFVSVLRNVESIRERLGSVPTHMDFLEGPFLPASRNQEGI